MEFDTADLFANESAEEELQVLRSIFTENELQEKRTKERQRLFFKINPDFGSSDEIVSRRYCSLQLEIDIDCNYPACSPIVQIKNPRGLTQEEVHCLETQISSYLSENKGQLVLYDIIQLAQDFSVSEEVPTLPCSICLNRFLSDDSIFVTSECHHHFHSHCLGRYIEHCLNEKHAEREILPPIEKDKIKDEIYCPLCRCLITCPSVVDLLNSNPPEYEVDASYEWSHLANPIDQKFRDLYEKQKLQGGLIDHEEERKRMLVTDDLTISIPINSAAPNDELCAPSTSKTKSETGHTTAHHKQLLPKEFKHTGKNKRHYYHQNNKRFYGYHNKLTTRNDEAKQSTPRKYSDVPPANLDTKNPDG